jgi:hypothetical protein
MPKKNKPKFTKFTCAVCGDKLIVQYPGGEQYCLIDPETGRVGSLQDTQTQGPEIICMTSIKHEATRNLTSAEIDHIIERADRQT